MFGLGGGAFAVAVLAACSGDDAGTSAASGSSSGSSSRSPVQGSSSGSPTQGAGTQAPDSTEAMNWKRVDMGFVSAYLLVRGDQAAMVDTGAPSSAGDIEKVLTATGLGWDAVRHVIVTHLHDDHAGSMDKVMELAGTATGYAGQADIAQISSPRELRPAADGEKIFGLRVIATPGHTAGHISVYDEQTGVLVAGDALGNTGALSGSNPRFTADAAAAKASVAKLAELTGLKTILFGHGAPLETGAAQALTKLAAS